MGNFFAELKHRHIYRVGAAYVVVAWALTQLVEILAQVFTLPLWLAQIAIVLLAVGFPVALLITWSIEKKPGEAIASAMRSKHTTVDWMLFGTMAVLVALTSYQQIAISSVAPAPSGVEAARSASLSPGSAISLAVLPFANLSGDQSQEFFSDGMTEEITSALAKVPDLRVVARTSAFEFKNKNLNIKMVGEQLGATHLIEGSVRKAGNRLRITAQLIKADDGTHIWAEDYDRELTDVFAIQEGIARAITAALRMPLGLKPGENLVNNRAIDVELYQKFLQLRAQIRAANNQRTREQVLPELEKLVARNPNFAPAWGYLSRLYILIQLPVDFQIWLRPVEETRRLWQSAFEKSEKAAREAIRLDPKQAFAYSNLARWVETNRKNWTVADDLHRKAMELDPYDSEVLYHYGDFLLQTGRVKEALTFYREALALEPQSPTPENRVALALVADGQANAMIAMLEGRPPRSGLTRSVLAQAYAMEGRFDKAADTIQGGAGGVNQDQKAYLEAARLIRGAPAKVSDPSALGAWHWYLSFVYFYVGATERLLDYPERAMEVDSSVMLGSLFFQTYTPVRKTERFKKLVRDTRLVDYWRVKGWPEFCHPTSNDDFVCE